MATRAEAGRGFTEIMLATFLGCWRRGEREVRADHLLAVLPGQYRPLRTGLGQHTDQMGRFVASDAQREQVTDPVQLPGPQRSQVDEFIVEAVLREVTWLAQLRQRVTRDESVPAWAPSARAAVRAALLEAETRGLRYATPAHLFAALLTGGDERVAALLAELGLSPDDALRSMPPRAWSVGGSPHGAGVLILARNGTIDDSQFPFLRVLTALSRADAAGWRPGGFRPIIMPVEAEAARQAVRCGAAQVTGAHYLLALAVLQEQCEELNIRLRSRWAAHNDAGRVLAGYGVTAEWLTSRIAGMEADGPVEQRPPRWRGRSPASVPFSVAAAAIAEKAQAAAAGRGHRFAGTSHILLALLAEHGDAAPAALLRNSGIHESALTGELEARLGRG